MDKKRCVLSPVKHGLLNCFPANIASALIPIIFELRDTPMKAKSIKTRLKSHCFVPLLSNFLCEFRSCSQLFYLHTLLIYLLAAVSGSYHKYHIYTHYTHPNKNIKNKSFCSPVKRITAIIYSCRNSIDIASKRLHISWKKCRIFWCSISVTTLKPPPLLPMLSWSLPIVICVSGCICSHDAMNHIQTYKQTQLTVMS